MGPAVLAAAAALLAVVGAYLLWPSGPEQRLGDGGNVAVHRDPVPAALPDEDLLAALELLEDWELIGGDDLDLLLATLDAPDELLLETVEETSTEGTAEPKRG